MGLNYVQLTVSIHGLDADVDALDFLRGWVREATKAGLLGHQRERFRFRNEHDGEIEVEVVKSAGSTLKGKVMGIIHLKDLAAKHNITTHSIRKFEARLEELGIKPAYEVSQGKGQYKLYKEDEVEQKLQEWLKQKEDLGQDAVSYADMMERLNKLQARLDAVRDSQSETHRMLAAVLETLNKVAHSLSATQVLG